MGTKKEHIRRLKEFELKNGSITKLEFDKATKDLKTKKKKPKKK